MGNYVSCTLSSPLMGANNFKPTKVILPSGEIQKFSEPIKAAELMLESPNFFLADSKFLRVGRRFSALNADEDLEMAAVYVMFPMNRLNSVVTAADLGALFLVASSDSKRRRRSSVIGNVRILPEYYYCGGVDVTVPENVGGNGAPGAPLPKPSPRLNLDDMEEFSSPEFKHRLSMCRSKKPLLETIVEEPVCSR